LCRRSQGVAISLIAVLDEPSLRISREISNRSNYTKAGFPKTANNTRVSRH
jgi:hypothetical protein